MLTATYVDNRQSYALLGDFAGTAEVQEMQTALAGLAQVTGNAAINPAGCSAGVVDQKTLNAVAAALPLLADKLGIDGAAKTLLQTALLGMNYSAAVRQQAATAVEQYAAQIALAAKAATAAAMTGTQPPATNTPPTTKTIIQSLARGKVALGPAPSYVPPESRPLAPPSGAPVPWYKNWKILVPVAVGGIALVGIGWWLLK